MDEQVESARLVLIQILLHDRKMNPLVSVYYYAPVSRFEWDVGCFLNSSDRVPSSRIQLCLILISVALPFMEGLAPFRAIPQLGAPILLLSGALAFSLNIAGVFLIDSAGSLVLTLSGVLKVGFLPHDAMKSSADEPSFSFLFFSVIQDIILIVLSVALLGSVIMPTQIGGETTNGGGFETYNADSTAIFHPRLRSRSRRSRLV
jgi:hypothetical protein